MLLVDFLKEKLKVKMGTRLTKNDSDSNVSTKLSETEIVNYYLNILRFLTFCFFKKPKLMCFS